MRRLRHRSLLALCLGLACAAWVRADPKELPNLIKTLAENPSAKARARAAAEIEKLGPEGRPAARVLCRAVLDRSKNVREAALNALQRVDPALHLPVSVLLEKRVGDNHLKAVQTIGKLKKDGTPATPLLRRLLNENLQEHFLLTLTGRQLKLAGMMRMEQAKNQPDDLLAFLQGLVNGMLNDLQNEVDSNEMEAVKTRLAGLPDLVRADMRALVQIAGDEHAVARTIATALAGPEVSFRAEAIKAVGDMDRTNAALRTQTLSYVVAGLKDPAAPVRVAAAEVIAGYGAHARKHIPLLKKLQKKDPAEEVRAAAAKALEAIEER
jgi:hypothetical protein